MLYKKKAMLGFVDKHRKTPLDQRTKQADAQIGRSDRAVVPVIMDLTGPNVGMDRHKFAFPAEASVMAMHHVVRQHASPPLRQSESLTVFAVTYADESDAKPTQTLVCASETLEQVYRKHASNDKNLYVVFCIENTFG